MPSQCKVDVIDFQQQQKCLEGLKLLKFKTIIVILIRKLCKTTRKMSIGSKTCSLVIMEFRILVVNFEQLLHNPKVNSLNIDIFSGFHNLYYNRSLLICTNKEFMK